jgi:hypothetical protein
MTKETILKIREVKKVYKSALCSKCTFHIAPLKTSLVKELTTIQDQTPLATYRINQLIQKIQNL